MADIDALVDRVISGEKPSVEIDELVDRVLGGNFVRAPNSVYDLDDPGLVGGARDLLARMDISRAEGFQQKVIAFQNQFPDGDLQFDVASGGLLFRRTPGDPYARVDAPALQPGGPLEVVSDMMELVVPSGGAIAGEALMAARSRGASLLPTLVKMGIGAFVGEQVQTASEVARGLRTPSAETFIESGKRGGVEAAFSVGGGFIGDIVVTPLFNLGTGRGLFPVKPGAERAERAARRLTEGDLPLNLVAESPMLQRLGAQSMSLNSAITREIVARREGLVSSLRGMRGEIGSDQAIGILEQTARAEKTRILDQAVRDLSLRRSVPAGVPQPQASFGPFVKRGQQQTGQILLRDIGVYEASSNMYVNGLYNAARKIDTPEFDLDGLVGSLDKTRRIAQDSEFGDINRLLGRIDSIVENTDLTRDEIFEKLRIIRTDAFDQSIPPLKEHKRSVHRRAGEIARSISNTLDSPLNANPGFLEAWQKANRAAKERFKTLEGIVAIRDAASNPTAAGAKLADLSSPQTADTLFGLQRALPADRYRAVQDGIITSLLDEPFELSSKLTAANRETINRALTPTDRAALKFAAKQFDKLKNTGFLDIRSSEVKLGAAINGFVTNNNTAAIETLVKTVKRHGGTTGSFARSLQAGLFENMANSSFEVVEGQVRLNAGAFGRQVDKLRQSGGMRLLTREQVSLLNDQTRLASFLGGVQDAGTSLLAASAVAGVRTLEASAIQTILETFGTGRIFTNPAAIAALTGRTGKKRISGSAMARLSGAMAAQMAAGDTESITNIYESVERELGI